MQVSIESCIEGGSGLMVMPTLSERVRDIENFLHWIKGFMACALLFAGAIGSWIHWELMPIVDQDHRDIGVIIGRQEKAEIQNDVKLPPQELAAKLPDVESALTILRDRNIPIDPKTLADLGQTVVELSRSREPQIAQAAWTTSLTLANYRSFLNVSSAPDTSTMQQQQSGSPGGSFRVAWQIRAIPGVTHAEQHLFFPTPFVSASQSAMVINIGRENEISLGPPLIVFDSPGFEIKMDGQHWRKVVIRNARIVYSGGPVILENVLFVNCTFEITKQDPGQRLAEAIVSRPETTFKNS